MFPLLSLLLLPFFITPGAPLKCEICEGLGQNCVGEMRECPLGMDTCAVLLTETSVGVRMSAIVKTCSTSSNCHRDPITVNMGNVGKIKVQSFCCTGAMCRKIIPTPSPVEEIPNGKTCPGCYSMHHLECETTEEVQCVGKEDSCLHISGTTSIGELTVTTVMKGCTSHGVCNEMDRSGSFSGINVIVSKNCTSAPTKGSISSGQAGGRNPTGVLGLILLTLSNLLLMMALS